jgi:hypothetical protein
MGARGREPYADEYAEIVDETKLELAIYDGGNNNMHIALGALADAMDDGADGLTLEDLQLFVDVDRRDLANLMHLGCITMDEDGEGIKLNPAGVQWNMDILIREAVCDMDIDQYSLH